MATGSDGGPASSRKMIPRKSFQEAMELTRLPNKSNTTTQLYMSHCPAWKLGIDLPAFDRPDLLPGKGAYGGVTLAQAALAAARALESEEKKNDGSGFLGLHVNLFSDPLNQFFTDGFSQSIQGVFTMASMIDRPFIHEVTPVQTGRSFATRMVTSRQPKEASSNPKGPFPLSDGQLPLDDICYTSFTTFKRSTTSPANTQATESPQQRYRNILSTRAPDEWSHCPQVDIDLVREMFADEGPGGFPMLDMRKVEMMDFNKDRPISERRELLYYRPLKPIPKDDLNGHIALHAYAADRNGLIMLGNHLGFGHCHGRASTLSYSFYMHTNAEGAVMDDNKWWIAEIQWPRASAGRGMMECRIWNPDGKHIASSYQDGIIEPIRERANKI